MCMNDWSVYEKLTTSASCLECYSPRLLAYRDLLLRPANRMLYIRNVLRFYVAGAVGVVPPEWTRPNPSQLLCACACMSDLSSFPHCPRQGVRTKKTMQELLIAIKDIWRGLKIGGKGCDFTLFLPHPFFQQGMKNPGGRPWTCNFVSGDLLGNTQDPSWNSCGRKMCSQRQLFPGLIKGKAEVRVGMYPFKALHWATSDSLSHLYQPV